MACGLQCANSGMFYSSSFILPRFNETHGKTILQRSPTFLAPGTGFVIDNFSTDRGPGGGGGGGMVQGVTRAMGSGGERQGAADQASLAHSLLTCCTVPNKLWTTTGPWPGGWGPL